MVWASHWDKLNNHSGQDIEHRSKRGVNKGDDGSTTLERLLLFGQNVPRWELSSGTDGPWV